MVMPIGLLALQGDYQKHRHILSLLGLESVLVRYSTQLDDISGLIIPGGESTTMSKLIDAGHFRQSLLKFAQRAPILGTCAGLIMMSKLQLSDPHVHTLEIMDVTVSRNAYGRQLDSFTDALELSVAQQQQQVAARFIRAPRIHAVGTDVEVLANYNGEPVAVRQGQHIGLTFHPELDDITLFHQLAFGGGEKI